MNNPIMAVSGSVNTNPETYGFVSTAQVLQLFADKGWTVDMTQIGASKKHDGFQKHLVTLTNPNFPAIAGLPEYHNTKPSLVLLNSHDKSTAFRLMLGLIRMACMNGIISGVSFGQVRVNHSVNAIKHLSDAIEEISANVGKMQELVLRMANTQVDSERAAAFITECYNARLANVNGVKRIEYHANPIRMADMNRDAFTLFNRVQEKLIRGGIHYTYERAIKDTNGNVITTELHNSTTRPIRSVVQTINVNRAVFDAGLKLVA